MNQHSSNKTDISLSLANPNPAGMNLGQKLSSFLIAVGLFICLIYLLSPTRHSNALLMWLSIGSTMVGGIWFARSSYSHIPAGIKNNYVFFKGISSRGLIGWFLGIILTGFYVCLYWFPETLTGLINLFNPLSLSLRAKPADQWFVYGIFYTVSVLVLGFKFILKYRNNRYQIVRSISVMFFQLGFAFLIPAILVKLNQPEYYFSYFWPLKKETLFPDQVSQLMANGNLGIFMVFWSTMMIVIATPILTYFFGKRWYCSWVCGCGGLAETTGDAFRQLSDKGLKSWKLERWIIYTSLVLIVVLTALLWINSYLKGELLGSISQTYAKSYGFLIGSIFSGVIGTGFYPILGSRSWCRFGCPMAATLGILQKYFSRFRITTNGGQCISCGNCSTYCEMGIDVRAYAQKGQNIVRASCVGCGVCSAVCPRGVLKLENGPVKGRTDDNPIVIDRFGARLDV
jgi:ferredoxin-type protein NapH